MIVFVIEPIGINATMFLHWAGGAEHFIASRFIKRRKELTEIAHLTHVG